jgi:hypothetical protein
VYPNSPARTGNRHKVVLTTSVASDDCSPPASYISTYWVDDDELPLPYTVGNMTIELKGPFRAWPYTIRPENETLSFWVSVRNPTGGSHAVEDEEIIIKVRPLGDIDDNGGVDLTDKGFLNDRINQGSGPYANRAYDLTGDGSIDLSDVALINDIINGVPLDQ